MRNAILLSAVVLIATFLPRAHAEDPAPPVHRANPCYAVDPKWPQKPDEMKWGETPGVAVDAKDNVWVFTRAKPPVQVYDAEGKFLRAWGDDDIKTAHYLRFDRDGNVWVADMGKHVVMQFAPDGKLLKTLGTPAKPGCD
jgi:sugar lactone lactonase YvrE